MEQTIGNITSDGNVNISMSMGISEIELLEKRFHYVTPKDNIGIPLHKPSTINTGDTMNIRNYYGKELGFYGDKIQFHTENYSATIDGLINGIKEAKEMCVVLGNQIYHLKEEVQTLKDKQTMFESWMELKGE